MNTEQEFSFAETARKQGNILRIGNIHAVDYANNKASVALENGDIVTDLLPWLAHRAGNMRVYSAPTVGEQVLLICPQGETHLGIILCGLFSDAFPPPHTSPHIHEIIFSDGGYVHYNIDNGQMNIKTKGNITIDCAATVNIIAPSDVNIQGNVNVSGAISATGNISCAADISCDGGIQATGSVQTSSDMVASGKSFLSHTHSGDSGGVTSPPL